MKKQLLALAAAVAVSPAAMAQQGYFGADFGFISGEFTAPGLSGDFESDPTALRIRGGVGLSENFALEGVFALGLQDDEITSTDADLELNSIFGINAVGILPLDRTFALFGKIGFAAIEFEDSDGDKYDDTGVSFGFGAKVNVDRNAALTLEYTILPDAEYKDYSALQFESEMISIGAEFAF